MKKQNVVLCPEWADKLALRQEYLSSAESVALQEHLATCSACASAFADFQDLIVRIRALPRPEMEIPMQELSEGFLNREVQKSENPVESNEFDMSGGLSALRKRKSRRNNQQYMLALVAVLLVALLTTSFALLFARIHTSNTGASQFRLTEGWTQLAFYQGKGSQTIHVGNLRLPMFWGTAESCQGEGTLGIRMTGFGYTDESGTDNCLAAHSPITAPAQILFALSAEIIQTIHVTAPTSMTWEILLVKETPSPAFSLSSVWAASTGIGATAPTGGNATIPSPSNGPYPLSSRWAVLTLCVGGGHGFITLDPGPGNASFSCDGQPALYMVDYPTATQMQEISVRTSGQGVWFAEVLMCTQKNTVLCR